MIFQMIKATINLEKSGLFGGCGCILLILGINLLLGGASFDYVLYSVLGKDIPWYGDMLAGLFVGEFTVPAAIVCWILRFWISAPFFG